MPAGGGWCAVTGLMIYAAVLVPAVLVALAVVVWRLWDRQRRTEQFMVATAECIEGLVHCVGLAIVSKPAEGVRGEQDR